MTKNTPHLRHDPPALVPKTTLGWLVPLAKAALAVLVLATLQAARAAVRHGQQMSHTPVR